ncbi:ISL3 family transposase [Methylorubrum sp. SL192]|uniref:ISL3 family transposase n=1 Tax=Methylorubrum sp. SL192 TaxID=2995167 RepID=UPI002276F73A|nr:ISL3 family transposase [Methylorubrum sp. SL192]MCY1643155.1 ISL3 family transposase [Methylorubrum sp. SL192]
MPLVPDSLHVEDLTRDGTALLITARTTAAQASCRVCGCASTRVHSTYWRTFEDLPWQDRAVTWRVQVRRFRCSHCPGRIFAERVPGLGARKARRSDRLAEAQTDIGMVLGGEPGARLSRRLAMPVSGDTVLRLIRRRGTVPSAPPRVVGIDDWAWRRGRTYGTIVCDLERQRFIDLLPGRSSAPVRDWLAAHPSVTVISRDRSGPYAEAARTAAPAATQVADRWHLLVNASEALRGIVERHQPQIRDVVHRGMHDRSASPDLTETAPTPEVNSRRRDRCETALCLHGEGLSTKEIARRIGASRNAVRRWLRAGRFMPYRRALGPSRLDRHLPFVETRWQEGQHSATVLHRELRAQGFIGSYDIVRRWAARRRQGAPARPPAARIPSTRRITHWLTSDPTTLSREDRAFADALCIAAPKQAAEDVRAFADLLRQSDPTGLTPWLEAAAATDLGGFVAGLRQDEAAVRAAIVEPWSNGPVEGQVNRLKLIKRSMYGRAKFDLLRQRVLHVA